MTTQTVKQNDLSPGGYKWYLAYLAALDAQDVEAYGGFLAEDCELGMNNDRPAVGKAAVLDALRGFFAGFDSFDHEMVGVVGNDHDFCGEAINHFVRLDGRRVVVRGAGFITRGADGLATRVRLYGDYSPLFAPE